MKRVYLIPKRRLALSLSHRWIPDFNHSESVYNIHLNLNMIVPYYNSILLLRSKNSADLNRQQCQVLQDYLRELFVSNSDQKQIEIRICCLGAVIKESIGEQMKRLIHSMLGQMKQIVWQINGRYSARLQSKLIYGALKNIEIKQGTNQKQPVQLQNLQLLKDYYNRYKSEAEMKDFLKNLLIEEISLEKKTIRYRKAQQVEILLRVMVAQISGEIEITYKHTLEEKQHSHKMVVWVLVASKDEFKNMNMTEIVQNMQMQYKIDRSVNQKITQKITIEVIEYQCQSVLKKMVIRYYSLKFIQFRDKIKQLKDFSNLYSNIKIVKQYGMKLWQDQQLLNRQFLKFIQEMRTKYSSVVQQYVQGWRQQQQFINKQRRYQDFIKNIQTIKKYMITVKQIEELTLRKKANYIHNCRMIQARIRSFLLVKTQQNLILNSYLQSKTLQLCAENKLFEQIKQLYNHYQLLKLANCNKYKYGFACITHIVAINNHSSYSGFAAERLLQFIQRANRNHELVVKLKCEQSYLQATTIEGKVYWMGCRKNSVPVSSNCNKQNLSHFNNSANTSAKSSNFNQRILQRSTFNRSSISQSKLSSQWNSVATYRKQSIVQNKQVADFKMKLDENCRLFVCGDNSYGELGLAEKYVNTFTCILPAHKVKLYSTINHHTIIVTTDNKVFYCGKGKKKLPQSNTPQQLVLKDKIVIKQIVNTINDTYFLTDRSKIYCLSIMNFIVIPKSIELQMEHFQLVRTGTFNLQIVYLVAYWTNTLDKLQRHQICRYLTSNSEMVNSQNESILVDDLSQCGEIDQNRIGDLSAILQSPFQ